MGNNFNLENFYTDPDININSEEYNIVIGFFRKVTSSEKSAEIFTLDLFRVSKGTNVPVLTLLESMKDSDKFGINEIMAYYLNQIRSQSALLGVKNITSSNNKIARNVIT